MRNDPAASSTTASEVDAHAAEELAYRLRQQLLTAEFGRYALKTRDIGLLLQEATRVCALGLHSDFCKVMEYLPDEGQFIVRAGVGWKAGVVGHARAGADTASPAGYAFETGDPVISNHLANEGRFRTPDLLAEHGIKRAINVLIEDDDRRFGILEVDSPTEGRFTEADLAFLQGFANLLGVAIERQQVEEALRTSEARLQEAVAHQEVLTREISHRVKNSLAIVAGLLNMQKHTASEPALQRALEDAGARVRTIAQVHDRLWRAHEVQTINLSDFLAELCEQFSRAAAPGLTLEVDIAPVIMATDQAVPLALLVNELATNAFKYAYPTGEGTVCLSIQPAQAGHLRLTLCDEGQGLPPDFDAPHSSSLGMKLTGTLCQQLGGQPVWEDAHPGTRFVLEFVAQEGPAHHA